MEKERLTRTKRLDRQRKLDRNRKTKQGREDYGQDTHSAESKSTAYTNRDNLRYIAEERETRGITKDIMLGCR